MLNISFILELTKRDFSERFAGSVLGSVWALIWPLVNLSIYIIIFGQLMGARLPGNSSHYSYGVYLTAGLVPWTAFAATISRSTCVFIDKRHLISKIRLSLPSLLLYVSLSESITFLVSYAFFFAFLILSGYGLNTNMVLLPFIYYLQQIFAFGFGLLFATLTVFIRDLREIVGIILQLWFWFTPIVYVREILPEFVRKILVFNPAYIFIESYQRIFIFNDIPSVKSLLLLALLTHLMLCLAYLTFRFLEKDVRDFL
jgi:lipopolysaccharide transport system permease protein